MARKKVATQTPQAPKDPERAPQKPVATKTGAAAGSKVVRARPTAAEVFVRVIRNTFYRSPTPPKGMSRSARNLHRLLYAMEETGFASLDDALKLDERVNVLTTNIKVHFLGEKKDQGICIEHTLDKGSRMVPVYKDGFSSSIVCLSDVQKAFPGQNLLVQHQYSPGKFANIAPVKDFETRRPLSPERYNVQLIIEQGATYNRIFCTPHEGPPEAAAPASKPFDKKDTPPAKPTKKTRSRK